MATATQALPLSGTGAVLIRVSSKKQEVTRQREDIAEWLRYRGRAVPQDFTDTSGSFAALLRKLGVRLYEDKGARDLSNYRPDFQRLLRDVEAGMVQWVVVQDIDRVGFTDDAELGAIICRFRRGHKGSACPLYTAVDDEDITLYDDMTAFKNFMRGRLSPKEQWTRSNRAHGDRMTAAKRGQYVGGPIPFGFDVILKPGDQVVWRYVVEGRGKGVKITADGREELCGGVPPHGNREAVFLSPSIREDRLRTAGDVFKWFATETLSYGAIARRLREQSIKTYYGSLWSSIHVRRMLRNPAYIGQPAGYKTSLARFYQREVTETGASRLGKVERGFGERVKQRRNPKEQWLAPPSPVFDPITTPELFAECQARMVNRQRGERAPQAAHLWLKGLVTCGQCGVPMVGAQYVRSRKSEGLGPVKLPALRCSSAARLGRSNPHGCRSHVVPIKAIEPYVEDFLRTRGETIKDWLNPARQVRVKELEDDRGTKLREVTDIYDRMQAFVDGWFRATGTSADIADLTQSVRRVWEWDEGGFVQSIESIYQLAYHQRVGHLRKELAAKEAEFARQVKGFADLTGPRAREQADRLLVNLEAEIDEHRARLEPLEDRMLDVVNELASLDKRIAEARIALEAGTDEQKTDAVRRVLAEIRLDFGYTAAQSHLKGVTVVPLTGDSKAFNAETESRSGVTQTCQPGPSGRRWRGSRDRGR